MFKNTSSQKVPVICFTYLYLMGYPVLSSKIEIFISNLCVNIAKMKEVINMNKKQVMYIVVVSITALFLAVVAVTAHSQPLNTPLYTFRMEQASGEMNFLPTEKNTFIYTSEKGYTLECNTSTSSCQGILSTSSFET